MRILRGHIFHVGGIADDGGASLAKRKGSSSFKTINFLLGGRGVIINHCEDDCDAADVDDDDTVDDDDEIES